MNHTTSKFGANRTTSTAKKWDSRGDIPGQKYRTGNLPAKTRGFPGQNTSQPEPFWLLISSPFSFASRVSIQTIQNQNDAEYLATIGLACAQATGRHYTDVTKG